MCLLDFCITYILTSAIVIIECISWLITVTDSNDARWKPAINPPVRSAFLTVLNVNSIGLWIITSCSLANKNRTSEGNYKVVQI